VLVDDFVFGGQAVRTKVFTVAQESGPIDVLAGRQAKAWQDDPFGLREASDA
jgi:hypothetical protein